MNEDILNQLGQPSEEPAKEIKVEDKKKSSGKQLDDEVLASMMANGDNTKGMFEPDESEVIDKDKDEKLHEEQTDEVKLKTKGQAKPSKKYESAFQKDILKNPENYYINTPKGEMTVKEAMSKGYNPLTRDFDNQTNSKLEQTMSMLNDKDREAVGKLFDPAQVGLAPADAESMGLKADSAMVRQNNPMEGTQMSSPSPAQVATPMSAPQQPAGQPDINSLLGGNV